MKNIKKRNKKDDDKLPVLPKISESEIIAFIEKNLSPKNKYVTLNKIEQSLSTVEEFRNQVGDLVRNNILSEEQQSNYETDIKTQIGLIIEKLHAEEKYMITHITSKKTDITHMPVISPYDKLRVPDQIQILPPKERIQLHNTKKLLKKYLYYVLLIVMFIGLITFIILVVPKLESISIREEYLATILIVIVGVYFIGSMIFVCKKN